MKNLFFKIGIIILFLFQILLCFGGYKDEILKLGRTDLLPQFQKDIAIKQISSYDTTGGNDDGFSGKYSYQRRENGQLVIADLKGSGVIERIWTPTPTEDTIRFYFDGESVPRIELKFIDLFTGKKYPFLKPVVGNEVGGYYCYIPIPYQNSCKIVYKGNRMQFFQIQYKEVTSGEPFSSFPKRFSKDEEEALSSVIETWKNSGNQLSCVPLMPQSQAKSIVKDIILKPGNTETIFSKEGGGHITGIEITPQLQLNSTFKDLILQARWDDEPVAAINSPFSDFFGYAFGKPSMQSMLVGVKNGVHYCYLPMPFEKSAKIDLLFLKSPLNQSTEIPVKVTIYYNEIQRSQDEGKLYAEWKREINPMTGEPYQILNKHGRGHYVGTMLQAQGLNPGMTIFFEGDDVCTVDGEMRLHGTGSEDYFNGGWYALADRWDQAFSLPLHGCLAYSIPLARTGGYRFFVTDKISFEHEFSLSIEHGPEKNNIPVDYTSVAFYYCDTPPVSNDLPQVKLLERINSPSMLEYWIALLPVKALSFGASISNEDCKDQKSGRNFNVLKLVTGNNGFAKFQLEVPDEGEYKLYISWFKGPACSPFEITQRQIPVSELIDAYAPENRFIEKQFIGTLFIKEGTNTISVTLDNPQKNGINTFLLHRIYLEKSKL